MCLAAENRIKRSTFALSCNRLLQAVDPFEGKATGEVLHEVILNMKKKKKFCDKQIAAPLTLIPGLVSLQTLWEGDLVEPVTPHGCDQKINRRLRKGSVSLLFSFSLWKHFPPQRRWLMTAARLSPRLKYCKVSFTEAVRGRGSAAMAKPWHVVYSGGKGEHYMLLVCSCKLWLLCLISATRWHCCFFKSCSVPWWMRRLSIIQGFKNTV